MTSIYPTQIHAQPHHEQQQAPLIYQIVVSEQLPCFDPTIFVKHLFMNHKQALRFTRFSLSLKPVIVPVYLVGHVLRLVDIFLPRCAGEILAVLLVVFQFPTIFLAIMAFRWEYVKVLVRTFEFCFLAATATVWVACAITYVQDLRAVLLSIVWIDFIDFVLIETYFGDSNIIFVIAITSGFYLLLLTGEASFSSSRHAVASSSQSNQVNSLTIKDALVNTMGTMVTLMVRLAYRKYNIMMGERDGATWTQSISYRCRIALRTMSQVEALNARKPLVQRTATTDRRQSMHFIQIPALFYSDNTVVPRIGSYGEYHKSWQLCLLYTCGVVGYTMSTFVTVASTSFETSASAGTTVFIVAITGLSATLVVWLYFLSCCQRQLLVRLCTSFDFIFLCLQLVASEISMCDLLKWRWTVCCGLFAELLWVICVLLLDALTPAMKARLRLKTWYGVLVVVLHVIKQLVFLTDILIWKRWSIQNRVLSDISVGGYKVQLHVIPFAFSRQITILIWCVRILYRIASRHTDDDLVMLLGNVEYECKPNTTESIVSAIATLS